MAALWALVALVGIGVLIALTVLVWLVVYLVRSRREESCCEDCDDWMDIADVVSDADPVGRRIPVDRGRSRPVSTPSIAERVAAGAVWLDANRPGWDQRIDLERLDISLGCDCVLGQEFGHYFAAPQEVRFEKAGHFGFNAAWLMPNDVTLTESLLNKLNAQVTAEWRRVIQERRTQAEASS